MSDPHFNSTPSEERLEEARARGRENLLENFGLVAWILFPACMGAVAGASNADVRTFFAWVGSLLLLFFVKSVIRSELRRRE